MLRDLFGQQENRSIWIASLVLQKNDEEFDEYEVNSVRSVSAGGLHKLRDSLQQMLRETGSIPVVATGSVPGTPEGAAWIGPLNRSGVWGTSSGRTLTKILVYKPAPVDIDNSRYVPDQESSRMPSLDNIIRLPRCIVFGGGAPSCTRRRRTRPAAPCADGASASGDLRNTVPGMLEETVGSGNMKGQGAETMSSGGVEMSMSDGSTSLGRAPYADVTLMICSGDDAEMLPPLPQRGFGLSSSLPSDAHLHMPPMLAVEPKGLFPFLPGSSSASGTGSLYSTAGLGLSHQQEQTDLQPLAAQELRSAEVWKLVDTVSEGGNGNRGPRLALTMRAVTHLQTQVLSKRTLESVTGAFRQLGTTPLEEEFSLEPPPRSRNNYPARPPGGLRAVFREDLFQDTALVVAAHRYCRLVAALSVLLVTRVVKIVDLQQAQRALEAAATPVRPFFRLTKTGNARWSTVELHDAVLIGKAMPAFVAANEKRVMENMTNTDLAILTNGKVVSFPGEAEGNGNGHDERETQAVKALGEILVMDYGIQVMSMWVWPRP
eukprot:g17783.t1